MNYTYLRQGDNLPTVGVLQKLLNRTGAGLDADGIFGPKTASAVRAYQAARGLKVDGIVGVETWGRLAASVDLPIVDCVDVFDAFEREQRLKAGDPTAASPDDLYANEVADLRAVGGDPIVLGGMSNGVAQAVVLIRSQARNTFLLRFHGHGAPGVAGIAAGAGGETANNTLEAASLSAVGPALRQLQGVFGPYGSAQLLQCDTADKKEGRELLAAVADLLGVPVSGGTRTQYGGGINTFRFEGPTRTAVPGGGSLKEWCRALPDFPK